MSNYNTEKEVWKDIKGYEGLYKVSDKGNIWSCRQKKEMKQRINKGYNIIKLTKNGKQTTETVSRLVALSFLNNPENKTQVNHIDENRRNNTLHNLEWVTSKENCNHGTRNERIGSSNGKRIAKIDIKTREVIKVYDSIGDAEVELGKKKSYSGIPKALKGNTGKSYGFLWKYI